ncbi:hypothetical protein BJ508DRAFT_328181 [Ascobolus immersus RN42]|uniref:Uncharacterized protein n=1 Tax=Ascobolus immersus RN42 TaxID=1160509 RepID=A0A3N4ID05_ASCIM|nr:hypothetical protein BJ508DRAFT_328181 [Ascobolus immersus RN42]
MVVPIVPVDVEAGSETASGMIPYPSMEIADFVEASSSVEARNPHAPKHQANPTGNPHILPMSIPLPPLHRWYPTTDESTDIFYKPRSNPHTLWPTPHNIIPSGQHA